MQYSYISARQDQSKHKDGNCQRGFICQHSSHQKDSVKKHVLIFEEPKNSQDNQTLLDRYCTKCILRRTDLTKLSKGIKLPFHIVSSNHEYHETQQSMKNESYIDSSVYILQTISIDSK